MAIDFPGSPTNGQVYTYATTGRKYLFNGVYWSQMSAVVSGTVLLSNLDHTGASSGQVIKSNGSAWAPGTDNTGSGGGGGIPEAATDGKTYGRKDADWVRVLGIDDDPGAEMYAYLMGTPNGTTLQSMLSTLYWRIGFNEVLAYSALRSNVFGDVDAMIAICTSGLALTLINISGAKSEFKASTALTVSSVPVMTDNTTPSGVASASTIYNSFYDAYRAFDNSSYWCSQNGVTTNQWVAYDFGDDRFVHTVTLTPGTDGPVKDFRIEYSNDNSTWTEALAGTLSAGNTALNYDLSLPGKYRYWRLFAINSNGGSYVSLTEMQLRGFDW